MFDSVALYNLVPGRGETESPSQIMFGRKLENPMLNNQPEQGHLGEMNRRGQYKVGDLVWVRSPDPKCTDPWREGTVTGIVSNLNVEVNGVPRHPDHLRRRTAGWHHPTPKVHEWPSRGGGELITLFENDDYNPGEGAV